METINKILKSLAFTWVLCFFGIMWGAYQFLFSTNEWMMCLGFAFVFMYSMMFFFENLKSVVDYVMNMYLQVKINEGFTGIMENMDKFKKVLEEIEAQKERLNQYESKETKTNE